jgi:hypothetical protein
MYVCLICLYVYMHILHRYFMYDIVCMYACMICIFVYMYVCIYV